MGDALDRPVFEKRTLRRLTDEQVRDMRWLHSLGDMTFKELGEKFGVSAVAAYNICKGVTYGETHEAPNRDLRAQRRTLNSRYRSAARKAAQAEGDAS